MMHVWVQDCMIQAAYRMLLRARPFMQNKKKEICMEQSVSRPKINPS